MVVVSYSGKEINAKLVYYGAGLSGKTTNLEAIYEAVPDTSRGKMVSMKTQSDRTLFFDLLPLDLGEIMGFKTRFLLYTVPGQVFYNATRKLVLKGADAIVFVADSEVGKMEENKDSLANLRANLAEYGVSLDSLPWVIQYNKRDLPNVYSVEELNAEINPGGKIPFFEAVAKDGKGVFETFRGISHLLMEKVTKDLRRGPMGQSIPSKPVVEEPAPVQRPDGRPAALNIAPTSPMHSVGREAHGAAPPAAPAHGGLDYGREIELPGDAGRSASRPEPAAAPSTPLEPAPVAHREPIVPREPVFEALPARPVPRPAPREPMFEAPQAAESPVRSQVAAVLDRSAMPAPSVQAAEPVAEATPESRPNGARPQSEEFVVPITLGSAGTHEIVLRIVLKVDR